MEAIQEDFDVFVHDGEKAFGAVRRLSRTQSFAEIGEILSHQR